MFEKADIKNLIGEVLIQVNVLKDQEILIFVTEEGIVMEVKPEQPLKQYCPIDLTKLGIVMEVNNSQPLKQYCPRDITKLGIVMESNNTQPEKQ